MPTYDESLYISVSEMSETYRVKQSWIYDQISAGKIEPSNFQASVACTCCVLT